MTSEPRRRLLWRASEGKRCVAREQPNDTHVTRASHAVALPDSDIQSKYLLGGATADMGNYLERIRRRAGRLFTSGPVILMYHHVGSPAEDPWKLAVSSERFHAHQEVLQQHRAVMSLKELARRHEAGRLPEDAAAITFDDGYASNLHTAKPILEKFALPATVFVTTGFLQTGGEPWWDQLARLLLGPTMIPQAVRLVVADRTQAWHAPDWSRQRREALHREIHRILVPCSQVQQGAAMDMLRDQIGGAQARDDSRCTVTPAELSVLANGDLIEIGAHTVSHPSLPSLPAAGQRIEIGNSKIALERRLGRPIPGFAYPYGDHNAASVAAVQDAGLSWACTTAQGFVHARDSRFRLPRFVVENWDGEAFAKRFARRSSAIWYLPQQVSPQPPATIQ